MNKEFLRPILHTIFITSKELQKKLTELSLEASNDELCDAYLKHEKANLKLYNKSLFDLSYTDVDINVNGVEYIYDVNFYFDPSRSIGYYVKDSRLKN